MPQHQVRQVHPAQQLDDHHRDEGVEGAGQRHDQGHPLRLAPPAHRLQPPTRLETRGHPARPQHHPAHRLEDGPGAPRRSRGHRERSAGEAHDHVDGVDPRLLLPHVRPALHVPVSKPIAHRRRGSRIILGG